MGGIFETIEAPTITELRRRTQEWTRKIRESDSMEVHWGWNRDRVEQTETGYQITVHAHS